MVPEKGGIIFLKRNLLGEEAIDINNFYYII